MENERKVKLLKYLFPTDEARKFICNNLFYDLGFIIKSSYCINYNNITSAARKKNLEIVKNQVKQFLIDNNFYLARLKDIYNQKSVEKIVDDLVIGYVFYLSNTGVRYNSFDIFKDRRSICYAPISIVDML